MLHSKFIAVKLLTIAGYLLEGVIIISIMSILLLYAIKIIINALKIQIYGIQELSFSWQFGICFFIILLILLIDKLIISRGRNKS